MQPLSLILSFSLSVSFSNKDTHTHKHARTHTLRIHMKGSLLFLLCNESLVCEAKIRHHQRHRNSIMTNRWSSKERHYSGLLMTCIPLLQLRRLSDIERWFNCSKIKLEREQSLQIIIFLNQTL